MGRKTRAEGQSEVITLRVTDAERRRILSLQQEQGLNSLSETLRWAVAVASREDVSVPSITTLIRRLENRIASVDFQGLADEEVVLTVREIQAQSKLDIIEKLIPLLCLLIETQVACHGWFYPPTPCTTSDALLDVQRSIVDGPNYWGMGRAGVPFLQSRMLAFWQTWKGPVHATHSPDLLFPVLRHILGLSSEERPVDFSLKALRRGMVQQMYAVSFFRPAVAAGVYRRWLGDVERPRVWDPSAGFGARMLGFFAAYPNGTYVAHEPAVATHRDLVALAQDMPGKATIHRKGSEFAEWEEEEFDLVFTSPPYFDVEKYFKEPGQVWVEYEDISSWREHQVRPTLRHAARGVRKGGYVIININHTYRDTFVLEAMNAGLSLHAEEYLVFQRSPLALRWGTKTTHKNEPILVFQKR